MSSPENLSTIENLKTSFKRLFGNLATHAARDHRAATSMDPRTLINGRLVPLPQNIADLIQQSPELTAWAEDPPFSTRKLLIIKSRPLLDNVQPRGWQTAEILNQSLPRKVHGRRTIVLQHWCRDRHPSTLLPSLIMQSLLSPVFNDAFGRHQRTKRSKNKERKFPLLYEEHSLEQREVAYLTRLFHRLIGSLSNKSITVYCVLDSVDCLEQNSSPSQRAEMMRCLFALVRFSCKGRKAGMDFRLLLMTPRFNGREPDIMQCKRLRRIVVEHGVVLSHGRAEEPKEEQYAQAVDNDSADDGSQSTEGSWHTAESGHTD